MKVLQVWNDMSVNNCNYIVIIYIIFIKYPFKCVTKYFGTIQQKQNKTFNGPKNRLNCIHAKYNLDSFL